MRHPASPNRSWHGIETADETKFLITHRLRSTSFPFACLFYSNSAFHAYFLLSLRLTRVTASNISQGRSPFACLPWFRYTVTKEQFLSAQEQRQKQKSPSQLQSSAAQITANTIMANHITLTPLINPPPRTSHCIRH